MEVKWIVGNFPPLKSIRITLNNAKKIEASIHKPACVMLVHTHVV